MQNDEKAMLIKAWLKSAIEDLETAKELLNLSRNSGCLFFCQLAVEKVLKAIFLKIKNTYPPYTHKLAKLAKDSDLIITPQQMEYLNEISSFNVEARYDILKEKLYKKANKEFTLKYFKITKELFDFFQKSL